MPLRPALVAVVSLEQQMDWLHLLLQQDNLVSFLGQAHRLLQAQIPYASLSFSGADGTCQACVGVPSTPQWSLPMVIQEHLAGHLVLSRNVPFQAHEQACLSVLLRHVCAALQPLLKHQHAWEQARTCSLTGLANRRAFDEELLRALAIMKRQKSVFSLLLLDLDDFKQVNDRWGHAVGDSCLQAFATRLTHQCRAVDRIFRMGGEEFACLLMNCPQADPVAERIQKSCQTPLRTLAGDITITASMGFHSGQTERHPCAWFKKADRALHAAKHSGKNRYRCYQDIVSCLSPSDP